MAILCEYIPFLTPCRARTTVLALRAPFFAQSTHRHHMNKNLLSVTQWKFVLIALVLISFALDIWANLYWERSVSTDSFGFGITAGVIGRDHRVPIKAFSAE